MRVFFSFACVAVMFLAMSAYAKKNEFFLEPGSTRIVTLGDSFMSGYRIGDSQAFDKVLGRRIRAAGFQETQVINVSESGLTSLQAAKKMKDILTYNPSLVLIELGVNDLLQKKSLKTAYKNIDFMIKTLKERDIKILLIGLNAPHQTKKEDADTFKAMYFYLAKKHKVPFYQNFMEGVELRQQYLQEDLFHPNPLGVEVMAQNIMPYVEDILRELELESGRGGQ